MLQVYRDSCTNDLEQVLLTVRLPQSSATVVETRSGVIRLFHQTVELIDAVPLIVRARLPLGIDGCLLVSPRKQLLWFHLVPVVLLLHLTRCHLILS